MDITDCIEKKLILLMESLFVFFVFEWKGTKNCFVVNHILQEVQYLI